MRNKKDPGDRRWRLLRGSTPLVKELYQARYIATRAKLLDWGRVRWKAEGFDLPLLGFDFETFCYGEQMATARLENAATSGPAAVKRAACGEPSTEMCGMESAATGAADEAATQSADPPGTGASPTGYWAGAERNLGRKNLGPQSGSWSTLG